MHVSVCHYAQGRKRAVLENVEKSSVASCGLLSPDGHTHGVVTHSGNEWRYCDFPTWDELDQSGREFLASLQGRDHRDAHSSVEQSY